MELNDYLKIIISGYQEDKDNLKAHLIRNQKIAERDSFVTFDDFYRKCTIVIEGFKEECMTRFYKRKNELCMILDLRVAKNENIDDVKKELEFISPDKLPVNLLHSTKGQFFGHLFYFESQYFENVVNEIIKENKFQQPKIKEKEILTLEDLFCGKNDIERCLQVLRDLDRPAITADNKYIGKNKGIFPLWIKVLQSQKPKSLINTSLKAREISQILNDSIEGLCLSKDASEFRKDYILLEKGGSETQIKALLALK